MPSGPVFSVCRTVGLLPIDKNGKFDLFAFVVSTSIFLLLGTVIVSTKLLNTFKSPFTFESLLPVSQYIFLIVAIVTYLFATAKYQRDFEEIFQRVLYVPSGTAERYLITLGTVLCFLSALNNLRLQIDDIMTNVRGIGLAWLSYLNFLVIVQFCSILRKIGASFQILLVAIRSFRVDVGDHFNLLRLARLTNKIYSVPMTIIFLQIFSYMVTYPYFVAIWYEGGSTFFVSPDFIHAMLHLSIRFLMLLDVCSTCQDTVNRVDSFNNELFRLMRENQQLCGNDKLYLYASMQNTITFTACGFFNLGYPFVTSIIAAAATYLVILLQFRTEGIDR